MLNAELTEALTEITSKLKPLAEQIDALNTIPENTLLDNLESKLIGLIIMQLEKK